MNASAPFQVGLIQMACTEDPEENLRRAVAWIEEAADQGAQVICLPELFRSRYFCQVEDPRYFNLAESIPGSSTETIARIATRRKVVVVVPVFERRATGLYHNSAVVLDSDGRLAGHYRKMHIPDDPAYYEKFYFTPGDRGFQSISTSHGKLGVLICWDQWYPEAARLTVLQGTEALFYPTAIGWHPREKQQWGEAQRDAWMTIQRSHAIANGAYVMVANRIGHEIPESGGDGIEFWGTSFVCDPFGIILAQASPDREEIVLAEVSPARSEEVRRSWPFLRDRRIDAYGGIASRYLDYEQP